MRNTFETEVERIDPETVLGLRNPSDAEHVIQCELARCKHPALYVLDEHTAVQSWCLKCRALANGQIVLADGTVRP